MDSRMVVVGNRLYMIMAVRLASKTGNDREPKTLQRIFDSFKLNPK